MSNTFCHCTLKGQASAGEGYLVDPHFKELFRMGHMSERLM